MLGIDASKFSKRMGKTVGLRKATTSIQLNTEMDKSYQAMIKNLNCYLPVIILPITKAEL